MGQGSARAFAVGMLRLCAAAFSLATTPACANELSSQDFISKFALVETGLPGRGYGEGAQRTPLGHIEYRQGRFSAGGAFGVVAENGEVLGAPWPGAVSPEALTRFVTLSGGVRLTRSLDATLKTEIGATKLSGGTAGAISPEEMISSSASASLRMPAPLLMAPLLPARAQASFTFAVSQPLRVEAGSFAPFVPTIQRGLALLPRTIAAAPRGREIDASATYSIWTAENFAARLSAIYAHEPRHDRNAEAEKAVTVGFHYRF